MAKYEKKKIQDTENSNFGGYQEDVGGGGSPNGPAKPGTHGHGVNSNHRAQNNDTMQPRTKDGKFTYKSANGKSIDPKYGPSRGKTVNPLLTGGENGIMIDDVEEQFSQKSGKYWDKYKDKWYQKGDEMVLWSQGSHHKAKWTTRIAGDSIWNVAKRIYNEVTGEFGGYIDTKHKLGNGLDKKLKGWGGTPESKTFEQGKKGRLGKEEKAAIQLAETTGEEQPVIDPKTGGFKSSIKFKPKVPTIPNPQPTPNPQQPTIPTQPTQPTQPTAQPTQGSQDGFKSKYSNEDIEQAKQYAIANSNGQITSDLWDSMTPEQRESIIDQMVDNSGEDNKQQPVEEDSETVKKIKDLGFSE